MLLKEKEEIIDWLDKYKVKNYTLKPDDKYGYVVDVAGDVFLWNKKLKRIAIKFSKVTGNFDCSRNKLTSLIGCPQHVNGAFFCFGNKLTSLEGCPYIVGVHFWCKENKLTSLKGAPESVGGHFNCSSNQLISLEGMPESMGGNFYCCGNFRLRKLQKIESFQEIKAYLLSQKLAMELAHDLDKNNRKIKL